MNKRGRMAQGSPIAVRVVSRHGWRVDRGAWQAARDGWGIETA